MKIISTREIVVEIECVRTIRKRCSTHLLFCTKCDCEADFITLQEAARLFEVDPELLNSYVFDPLCHTESSDIEPLLCLPSFLDHLRRKTSQLRSSGQSVKASWFLTD